jgi:NADPH-dependent curcumin reductase CurA
LTTHVRRSLHWPPRWNSKEPDHGESRRYALPGSGLVTTSAEDTVSRQYRLASRPNGPATVDNFVVTETLLPQLSPGQVLLRAIYLSIDPYVRGRMDDTKSYVPPMQIGEVIDGSTVCEVIASESARFAPGDLVLGRTGWQTHAVVPEGAIRPLRRQSMHGASLSSALGVLGMPGFTAYAGLLQIGKPCAGETVVVAAATGPVGSMVGQIAKLRGARAVGIAGGPVKQALLTERLGFDVGIDHRAPDLAAAVTAAVPDGVDVYFENVGGRVSQAVFPHLNKLARVPVCGVIADYDGPAPPAGPDRLPGFMRHVLNQSLTVRGFLAMQFLDKHYNDFIRDMSQWLKDGTVTYIEHVVDGLDRAPEAFLGMLTGQNMGKLVVRVADEPVGPEPVQ